MIQNLPTDTTITKQGRDLSPYGAPTQPTVYFVNGTTLRPKELISLEGNANGVSLSPDGNTIYVADTGASDSSVKPSRRNFRGPRDLWAWDFAFSAAGEKLPVLTNRRRSVVRWSTSTMVSGRVPMD